MLALVKQVNDTLLIYSTLLCHIGCKSLATRSDNIIDTCSYSQIYNTRIQGFNSGPQITKRFLPNEKISSKLKVVEST